MKIEFEKPKQIVHFSDLDIGTVFKGLYDDTVYMKTDYIDSKDDEEINSIDLTTGECDCFAEDTKVYAVDATLYIKE